MRTTITAAMPFPIARRLSPRNIFTAPTSKADDDVDDTECDGQAQEGKERLFAIEDDRMEPDSVSEVAEELAVQEPEDDREQRARDADLRNRTHSGVGL